MWLGGTNIDATKIDYSLKAGNKFLFVGIDFERKNGPLVIEAFRKLRIEFEDLQLYIAGPEKQPYRGDCAGITFMGRLSTKELEHYYNQCDYFVMPSRFEAYGLVFIEALTYGLPCIGKNCYAMPEIISDNKNGYLIENDDAEELCLKMKQMLLNLQMKEFVRKKRDEYIKEYSWDTVAQRIMNVIENNIEIDRLGM